MEEQKKYFIISTIMFIIIAIVILQVDKYHDNKVRNSYTLETNKLNNQYINVNDFGIYLQDKENSNNYTKQTTNNYPTQGYILNTSRTKCFDYHGSEVKDKVSQTDEGRIRLETTVSIYCQMYFDIDKDAPSITSMSIDGLDKDKQKRTDYIYEYNINYNFSWSAQDVVYYCVKEGNNTCNESDWQKTNGAITKSGTITVNTEGAKTIYAYIRDKAKNVSIVMSKTITVDRTAPTISGFTLTGSNASGTSLSDSSKYTHTTSVSAKVTWADNDVASYCITTSSSCSTSEWTTISSQSATKSITTSAGQGNKSYNAFIKDKAGNVSTAKTGSIYLDTEKPTATISSYTSTETSITVNIGGTDSGSGISTRECRVSSPDSSGWVSANSNNECTINTLSNGNKLTGGTTYTIEVRTSDKSGRVSDVLSKSFETALSPDKYIKSKNPKGLNTTSEFGGLYRFYGACYATSCKGIVDNFICFGTDNPEEDCAGDVTSDYMYRIIGIDPETGDLKLIKNSSVKEGNSNKFQWHSSFTSDIEWPNSDLFKRLNGEESSYSNLFIDSSTSSVQYIKSRGDDNDTKWYNMIKDTNWLYGDIGATSSKNEFDATAATVYKIETGILAAISGLNGETKTWTESVRAKIGLMYVHDYYYAVRGHWPTPNSVNCMTYPDECSLSWLHFSRNSAWEGTDGEWMISRFGSSTAGRFSAMHVWGTDGYVHGEYVSSLLTVRPVFYLDASRTILTGSGTYDDPFVAMPVNGLTKF